MKLIYKQPFSDLHSLSQAELEVLKTNKEALVFGHGLTDQIGGQLDTGFIMTDPFEDNWVTEIKWITYFPVFLVNRVVKPKE